MPRHPFHSRVISATILALAGHAAGEQRDDESPMDSVLDGQEIVYYDFIDDAGKLSGGRLIMPIEPDVLAWHSALAGSPPDNRIDLVTVGDGYTASQLGTYAVHAGNAVNALFAQQPFQRYQHFYRVTSIDVVSIESGVDNDPVQGVIRNTALDMAFWCSGIERLLCVNVQKAYQYAIAAPDVDQVLAVANSTKYGGAGYSGSELATVAGGNSAAAEVAIHEFGHSIGNLADEYDYADGATYSGPEPSSVNASILNSTQMAAAGTKWAAWLNWNDPQFDSLVSTYQGCAYYQFGVNRPTNNSKMRSLGRPFNPPSVEALIIEMYKIVKPTDASSDTSPVLNGTETLFVTPMTVVGSPALTVQWRVDNVLVSPHPGNTLDLSSMCLSDGAHVVTATVRDPTPWVRNETARAQWMTQTKAWNVMMTGCAPGRLAAPADVVNIDDLLYVIARWAFPGTCADLSGNGFVNIDDLLDVINAWGPCP